MHEKELKVNGYEVLRGKRLKEFKLLIKSSEVSDINVGQSTASLGVFNFKSFLNLGILLTESEKARSLRSVLLDIVLDTINKRTGGSTKYINQRDEDFILSYYKEESYSKEFTDALSKYIAMGNAKYAIYTNKIYQAIFKEHAAEYRQILKLSEKDNVRETMYSEVLDLISSYEYGPAKLMEERYDRLGRQSSSVELDQLFSVFEKLPLWIPLVEKARRKMASRDLAFRDELHQQLEEYIGAVPAGDFERFLGEKSKELARGKGCFQTPERKRRRLFYVNIEQVMEIHRKTIEVSGGGDDGVLDPGILESVLDHIQNDDYYPNFEDKLSHLFFCILVHQRNGKYKLSCCIGSN